MNEALHAPQQQQDEERACWENVKAFPWPLLIIIIFYSINSLSPVWCGLPSSDSVLCSHSQTTTAEFCPSSCSTKRPYCGCWWLKAFAKTTTTTVASIWSQQEGKSQTRTIYQLLNWGIYGDVLICGAASDDGTEQIALDRMTVASASCWYGLEQGMSAFRRYACSLLSAITSWTNLPNKLFVIRLPTKWSGDS